MHYVTEITIDLPLRKVLDLFENPDNMKDWQPSLKSVESISGEPGKPGAKATLVHQMGQREIEMVETILEKNLPDTFRATYEAQSVFNEVNNTFKSIDDKKTLWIMANTFKFSGLMAFIPLFLKGSFKKETSKNMQLFKQFAESV